MQEKSTVELLLANLAISFFSSLLYEKRHYVVKPKGIEYVWQSWTQLMIFPDCFYYANMNQSLLLLFLYLRQSVVLIGRALENIVYFVSDWRKKRRRFLCKQSPSIETRLAVVRSTRRAQLSVAAKVVRRTDLLQNVRYWFTIWLDKIRKAFSS